jgi:ankyrin repeat protein
VLAGNLEILKLLLSHPGVDFGARDTFGYNALHYAALYGHLLMVKELLKVPRLNVNEKDVCFLSYNVFCDLKKLVLD